MVEMAILLDMSVCTVGMVLHTSNVDPTLMVKQRMICLDGQCHSLMMAVYKPLKLLAMVEMLII